MHTDHVDAMTRTWTILPSRRDVLRGLAGAGLGLGSARLPVVVAARKKRQHKNKEKKARPNAFGCLEVGDPCKNATQCCSGSCDGRKGNKRCRAHDTGVCDQEAPGYCESASPFQTRCNNQSNCFCTRTTAGSNICGTVNAPSVCTDCKKDADCEALGLPLGSACVPFSEGNCAGNCEGGMACMALCGSEIPDPQD
jgi:hypothetical protein